LKAAVTHEGYTPPEHLGRGAMLFLRDGAFEVVGIDLVAGVETLKVKHRLDHVLETLCETSMGGQNSRVFWKSQDSRIVRPIP